MLERLATECSVTIFRRIDRPDGNHAGRAFVIALSLSPSLSLSLSLALALSLSLSLYCSLSLSLHRLRSLRRLPSVCADAQGLMKKWESLRTPF